MTDTDTHHPLDDGSPVISVKPVVLPAPGRGVDLQVRISAPTTGASLPVIVFSHGFGSSLDGYGPLTDYWAAHGFVVIQATYLDSRRLGVPPGDPRAAQLWRYRVEDAKRILDNLDVLEAAVPGLPERVDHSRIAAAGHSFGGQTTGILLGLRVLPPAGDGKDMSDSRVTAGILLGTAGAGGENLKPGIIDQLPWLNVSFEHLNAPALVVAGDHDQTFLTVRGPDWAEDPYHLSPGPKSLLTVFNAEHSLGGIPGYDAKETTDENPEALALLQRVTVAYLRDALGLDHASWPAAVASLAKEHAELGRIESKQRLTSSAQSLLGFRGLVTVTLRWPGRPGGQGLVAGSAVGLLLGQRQDWSVSSVLRQLVSAVRAGQGGISETKHLIRVPNFRRGISFRKKLHISIN